MNGMDDDALMVAGQIVSLRSLVTDRLRIAIVTGRFPPGKTLRERELCELMGVSRLSLREALRQLEAEGLISKEPRRGPAVTLLSAEEVGHIYELRIELESLAVQEFARRRKSADLDALRAAVERLNEVEDSATPLEMLEAGSALYKVIAAGSGNPYIVEELENLHNRIKLIRFISLHKRKRVAESFDSLRALSAAIAAGEAELAGKICREHLYAVAEAAKEIVEAGYRLPPGSE